MDVDNGLRGGRGDYLNLWECHPETWPGSSQNFTIKVPDPRFPDQIELINYRTGLAVNVLRDLPGDDRWLGLWDDTGERNELFHLHPPTPQLESADRK
ncbi:RICIN domain-containing protein [Streptomyces sp. NPDC059009]|uniref:RICIN domain-containing protein n=1 Tax=Streptomyces sp. NPDC059009 TaxID=3346694 RepID=UPI003699AC30